MSRPPLSADTIERMRMMRRQGLSAAACARVVGVHPSTGAKFTKGIVPYREPSPHAVNRALRIERFYASCNRALAEARA